MAVSAEERIKVFEPDAGSGACLLCEKPYEKADGKAISVSFDVRLSFVPLNVKKWVHRGCAKVLREILGRRIEEADGGAKC